MTEKEFKKKYKRVVRYKKGKRYVFDFKKNKLVPDTKCYGFYACECGCKLWGSWDLWLVEGKTVCMEHFLENLITGST